MTDLRTVAVVNFDEGRIVVWTLFPWAGVDRPMTHGTSYANTAKGRALADRHAACINDQAAHGDATIRTDINGATYVEASPKVLGKWARTDLERLGY